VRRCGCSLNSRVRACVVMGGSQVAQLHPFLGLCRPANGLLLKQDRAVEAADDDVVSCNIYAVKVIEAKQV
jgi:hypothetical protein